MEANKCNIHTSLICALILPQIFGFFPVYGIRNADHESLKFSWLSLKTLYSLATFVFASFATGCQVYLIISTEINMFQMDALVYLSFSVLSCVLFIKLAKEWPDFIREWRNVEADMGKYGLDSMQRKLNVFLIILTVWSLIEHVCLETYRLLGSLQCSKTTSDGIRHFYVNITLSNIFQGPVNYSLWTALVFQFSNLQMTFCWTYVDTFLILLSIAFEARVKQFGMKIKLLIESKVKTDVVWKKITQNHDKLYNLCLTVNQRISYLILLSFISNLYFVLVQLFNSLRPMNDMLEKTYFFISFGFLIFRIISVILTGASINTQYTQIRKILASAPSGLFSIEMEKLLNQIIYRKISLTGKEFFTITKGLLLKIAGAIVTYELVLIQFNKSDLNFNEESVNHQSIDTSYWICN